MSRKLGGLLRCVAIGLVIASPIIAWLLVTTYVWFLVFDGKN